MRSLTVHNSTETVKSITEPFYLLHMGFDVPVYLCSLKTITLDSITWSASRSFKVQGLKSNASNNQRASISIDNADNLVSGLILAEGCAGKICKIYKGYGNPASSDLEMLFDGEMDGSTVNETNVAITLNAKKSTASSPNIFIRKPDFNYIPPAGTIIKSGSTTITLQGGR